MVFINELHLKNHYQLEIVNLSMTGYAKIYEAIKWGVVYHEISHKIIRPVIDSQIVLKDFGYRATVI